MNIKLKNFKQHKRLEIAIPNTGMVRLSGKSGAGKSTVLEAIDFAVNGNGSDLVSWGSNNAEVEVYFEGIGLMINRTLKPNSLAVSIDGVVEMFRDDAAQEMIYNTLGVNAAEFDASAYIKQQQENSILNLKPAEQLRFVQSLADGEIDPDTFKKFINSKIKELEYQRANVDRQIADRKQLLDKNTKDLDALQSKFGYTWVDTPKLSVKETKDKLDKITAEKETLSKIAVLQEQVEPITANIQKLQEGIAADHNTSIQLASELALYDREYLIASEKYNTASRQARNTIQAVRDQYNTDLANGSATVFLRELRQTKSTAIDGLNERCYTLKKQLQELKKLTEPQPCPECSTPLMVVGGVIHKHTKPDTANEIRSTQSELQLIEKDLYALKDGTDKIDKFLLMLQTIQQEMQSINLKGQSSLNPDELINQTNEMNTLSKLYVGYQAAIQSNTSVLASLLTQKQKIHGDINKLSVSIGLSNTHDTHLRLSEIPWQIEQASLDYTNALSHEHIDQTHNTINKYKRDIDNLTLQLGADQEKYNYLTTLLQQHQQVYEISEKAALEAIENTIDMINSSTQKYIDAMFQESGTSVLLSNTSKTLKGEERAKIGVEMYHNGNKVKNIKSFSGGERSRLALAFQLGLADLYKCPFLLIDEGFTGVDFETLQDCLEFLKQFADNRLILVIEHHAPESVFDHIVNI